MSASAIHEAPHEASLADRARTVADDARALERSVSETVQIARERTRDQLRERPYLTLGAAAATGFVLAGGLGSRVGRSALQAGLRLAVSAALRRLTTGAAAS